MTSIAAWLPLMRDTVTIAAKTGQDGFADPTYGTGVVYKARVVGDPLHPAVHHRTDVARGFAGPGKFDDLVLLLCDGRRAPLHGERRRERCTLVERV